ncbi:MAG: hypothetical protein JWQ35_735 [Bacteriovoracaceae bacterium]|nr:hypothetical protein [Bacteriovoracaceae bacterium]
MRGLIDSTKILLFFICQLSFLIAAPNQASKKPWTVLVYLNADNNLEDDGYNDLREMERVGSSEKLNVVVQFAGVVPAGTERIYVEKATGSYLADLHTYQSKNVEVLPPLDMGDAKTFVDFVTWGMDNYPADNYMVIMWNHGSGWDKDAESSLIKGISYDDSTGNHITTNQLADALDQITSVSGNRINVLAMDACLMSMYEVADSLAGMTDYLVASEETIPGNGYPYDDLLKIFVDNDVVTSEALARHLVNVYGKSYEVGGSQNHSNSSDEFHSAPQVTLAAINLSRLELVKRRLGRWINALKTNQVSNEVLLKAVKKTTTYEDSRYKDLGDFVKHILEATTQSDPAGGQPERSSGGLVGASLSLLKSVQEAVIANYNSPRFVRSTGISIYIPYEYGSSSWNDKYSTKKKEYLKLKWAKTTDWASFLDGLFPMPVTTAFGSTNAGDVPPVFHIPYDLE